MEEQITIWTAEDHRRDELRKALPQKKVRRLISKKGGMCIYCETEDHLELHHIIPIASGGDNRESNLVPLCEACHLMAHNKVKKATGYKKGRPRKQKPKNFDQLAREYISGKYSLKEFQDVCGAKRCTIYRWLNEYRERTGNTALKKWAFPEKLSAVEKTIRQLEAIEEGFIIHWGPKGKRKIATADIIKQLRERSN